MSIYIIYIGRLEHFWNGSMGLSLSKVWGECMDRMEWVIPVEYYVYNRAPAVLKKETPWLGSFNKETCRIRSALLIVPNHIPADPFFLLPRQWEDLGPLKMTWYRVSKKLSFTKLSIWRSSFQFGRNTYDIRDKSGNTQFGKTQLFWDTL